MTDEPITQRELGDALKDIESLQTELTELQHREAVRDGKIAIVNILLKAFGGILAGGAVAIIGVLASKGGIG